jgi:uncharacterized protein (TIGR02246 family)
MNDELAAELEALERRGWEALSGPNGATFYDDVMAPDGLMVFPGLVMDKDDALEAMRTVAPWAAYELQELRVIPQGPDGALVVYRATAQREGERTYEAWMTSAYARRDGRWLLVLHQQTPDT